MVIPEEIKMKKFDYAAIGLIALAVALVFIDQETIKDWVVNGIALIGLVAAFMFYKKVGDEDAHDWMDFMVAFILFTIFVVVTRVWDNLSLLKDVTNPEMIDPSLIKLFTKIGERLGFVGMSIFGIIGIKALYTKLTKELSQ